MLQVGDAGQSRHLMDDHVWHRTRDRVPDRCGVEAVHDNRLRAERLQPRHLPRASGRRDDVMTVGGELGHEAPADRTAGACNEHTHPELLSFPSLVTTQDEGGHHAVTASPHRATRAVA